MNRTRLVVIALWTALLGGFMPAHAEDVDIYSNNASSGVPNVLLLMDTAANFSASAATCTYTGGGSPSLNGTAGGIEQCALVNAIAALPDDGTINIGLMVYNANNFTSGAAAGVGPCIGSAGGCLLKPLTLMNATGKADLIAFIKSWTNSGSNSATQFNVKTNSEATASLMQEAWAYYNGQTGLSGKNYGTSLRTAGCQRNFIIFVGNAFDVSGTPGDPPDSQTGADTGLAAAVAGLTTSQQTAFTTKLTNTVSFASTAYPTTCGVTICGASNVAGQTNCSNSQYAEYTGNWLDEWANYMYQTGIDTQQNVITYTIGVLNNASCKPQYPALLKNTADYGGGKYYAVSYADDLRNAMMSILNEVQAVNSVFASSSLPVSVNAQGTYLNQIYMGMFRPDPNGYPRWAGNLKQYSFLLQGSPPNQTLTLGDSVGQQALSSSTGFLAPNAVSYWTCAANPTTLGHTLGLTLSDAQLARVNTCARDPAVGFWSNNIAMVNAASNPGKGYDIPDGQWVEKGGAAQQLRLVNLTDDYTATAASANNPRKLFTYCPSGSSCVASLADASNAVSSGNAGIAAADFGSSINLNVTSLTRTGTTATVTTAGAHGLASGNLITIQGASPNDYNGPVTITVTGSNTFTYPIAEYPPTTATIATTGGVGGYAASSGGAGTVLTGLSRTAAGTNKTAAVTGTMGSQPFSTGNTVTITGSLPQDYNLTQSVTVSGNSFTMPVSGSGGTSTGGVVINPVPNPVGTWQMSLTNTQSVTITAYSCNSSSKVGTVTATNSFHAGDRITISGDTATPASKNANGSFNVLSATSAQFTYNTGGCPTPVISSSLKASTSSTPVTITSLTRNETAVGTATVTATVTANAFAPGDLVTVSSASPPSNETGYAVTGASLSCATTPCGTTVTYTISTTPTAPTAYGTASTAGATQAVTSLTRSGSTATATVAGAGFANGAAVTIATASGTSLATGEGAYVGSFTITCVGGSPCTTFTYPVTVTPTTPAAGTITASSTGTALTAAQASTLINWIRGEDNYGDEKSLCPPGSTAGSGNCPSPKVTVRPSLHGDVLHSRPAVINYGGSTGVVVFYGDNGGVFHATDGNQPGASTTAGQELWGFIPSEFFDRFNRLRSNSPQLLLPTTPSGILPSPQKKDYFIDGPTGVYQLVDGSGSTVSARIYLTMRRGGAMVYALDVTNPAAPSFLWKATPSSVNMSELGETWSLPKVARVKGYANPVVIFGAGYDVNEDTDPPTAADVMGRGIFVLDAATGALVWSATPQASGSTTCSGTAPFGCQVSGMNYAIPSDISLLDTNGDGYIDRFYVGDTGGNVWRVDLEPNGNNTPDNWRVNQLAALGCAAGACSLPPASTQRKFFFAPEVIATSTYYAVIIGSGDREHPLKTTSSDKLFMLKDTFVGNSAAGMTPITVADLFDATSTAYAGSASGYYITLASGEKIVNAPLVTAGYVYFGTNKPVAVVPGTCAPNLGEARGYRVQPFTGAATSSVFTGGGLPPSPVSGIVNIATESGGTVRVPFLIGGGGGDGGGGGGDAGSALGGQKPPINVSTNRIRTYWYLQGK
jgi:Tfp pilus tip-associated adhesin PilY1